MCGSRAYSGLQIRWNSKRFWLRQLTSGVYFAYQNDGAEEEMRLARIGVLIGLVLVCNGWMLAFDPGIHVDDPQGPGTPVGLSFTFTSDASGGGLLNFVNTSGVTFTTLEFNVPAPLPSAPIVCGGNAYPTCFRQWLTEGEFATVDFNGGPGIPDGTMFQVDLGTTGWTPNATFEAFANETDEEEPTPEPGVLTLLASGLAAVWFRRSTFLR
jgi:hypothetical protein